jgi:acylphosphatase
MINRIVVVLFALLGMVSCGKKSVFQLEGNLSNLKNQTIYAVFEGSDKKLTDTITCQKNGRFEIKQEQTDINKAVKLWQTIQQQDTQDNDSN